MQYPRRVGELLVDSAAPTPGHSADAAVTRDVVHGLLLTLPPREQQVLELRFGLGDGSPLTCAEIGRRLGVTREYIRQIEAKALKRLRHPSRTRILRCETESA